MTGWPGVTILWLREIESVIYNFCVMVAAQTKMFNQIGNIDTLRILLEC